MQLTLKSRHNGAAPCKRTRCHRAGDCWCHSCASLASVLPIFFATCQLTQCITEEVELSPPRMYSRQEKGEPIPTPRPPSCTKRGGISKSREVGVNWCKWHPVCRGQATQVISWTDKTPQKGDMQYTAAQSVW
eukprot:5347452-Amphidinium_carterae.1